MKFSTTPVLLIAFVVAIVLTTRKIANKGHLTARRVQAIYLLLTVLVAWGILSSAFALTGVYSTPKFLSLLPGLWLPFIPFVLVIGGLLIFPQLSSAIHSLVDHTLWNQMIFFQALRILALGTLFKAYMGLFPIYFALYVGIPDLMFGVSALFVGYHASRKGLSQRSLIIWNMIGAAIVMPAAPLLQMGLPGRMQIFTAEPSAQRLFDFPMVIAPTLVVPLFFLFNILAVWSLMKRGSATN